MNSSGPGDLLTFLVNISSIFDPLIDLIVIISTILGVVLIGKSLLLGYHLGQNDGKWMAHGEAGIKGVIWGFVIGGILVTPIMFVGLMGNTLLNGEAVTGTGLLYQSAGLSAQQQQAVTAIFGLFTVMGFIAFIHGWLDLHKHFNGESRNGPAMGVTQIVGGTLLVYLDVVLQFVSEKTGFDFIHILLF